LPEKGRFELSSFNWDTHFVWSPDGNKCLGACALMAIRYWGIEVSEQECGTILEKLSVPAFEGPDARQIVKAVEQVIGMATEIEPTALDTKLDDFISSGALTVPATRTQESFSQEFFHARDLSSLRVAFRVSPHVPQIVIYDDVMASFHEESPGGHAALVHTLDFDTRFIYLVDPNAPARRGSPIYYTFDDFERGWRSFEQATVILYPSRLYKTVRSLVSMPNLGGSI
jgi:hypothetical protein